MELAHIPQQTELSALYGSWNPLGYMEGIRNQGLADQFREQGRQANVLELDKQRIANEQSEQMNPLLLAQQGLVNTGLGTKNTSDALALSNKQALNEDQLKADRAKLRQQYSESEISQMQDNVLREHMNNVAAGNLAGIEKTRKLLDFLGTPAQTADRLSRKQIADENNITQLKATGMSTSSAERINQANIEAGKYDRNKFGLTIQDRLMRARTPTEKAEVLEDAYYVAVSAGDMDAAQLYQTRAQAARERVAEDARNRGLATPGLDVGAATGMPAKAAPSANAPIAGGASGPKPGTAENPIVLK